MEKPQLSTDPLKTRVIRNILGSRTRAQLESSKRYAELAGLQDDELVKEWLQFKRALIVI